LQLLKDVMSRDVKVVSPDSTISEAARQMRIGNFGMLPVAENDRLIGAISDRDIAIRAVADGRDSSTLVREVMSKRVWWAFDDDTVDDAAELMGKHKVRRLPILGSDKRLIGIVAVGDLAIDGSDLEAVGAMLSEISKSQP
jgi:CBS domain-containing protein